MAGKGKDNRRRLRRLNQSSAANVYRFEKYNHRAQDRRRRLQHVYLSRDDDISRWRSRNTSLAAGARTAGSFIEQANSSRKQQHLPPWHEVFFEKAVRWALIDHPIASA